ncbi:SAM-dependent methyltransferase [Streptomyces aidingensis]|uniref:S-adenosyl methyltransferase n=1 Tax=Streptomyces aidingensis TaxID=910347 RepID=A0A1I1IQF5_9ACTN|nr:S-adenosyl methyltransferase [Streptomyces aidingensis]
MTEDAPTADAKPLPDTGGTVPHSARIWNYWLGGKDNFETDRLVGGRFSGAFPAIADDAPAYRHFPARAGIRQFPDLGAGLPTVGSTHEPEPGPFPPGNAPARGGAGRTA